MIDIEKLRLSTLHQTPPGALFVPVADDGSHFVAGVVGDTAVLVALDGEQPFLIAETGKWSRALGFIISDVRFQVDPTSGSVAHDEGQARLGSLVRIGSGVGLIGTDKHQMYTVWLTKTDEPRGIERGDVPFAKWQIVSGQSPDLIVHFSHDGPKAEGN